MVLLFYTTYISVDLAHHEIFCDKVGKGGISMQNGDLALPHKKFMVKPIYRFANRCLDNVKMFKYAIFDLNIMLFKRYEHFHKNKLDRPK